MVVKKPCQKLFRAFFRPKRRESDSQGVFDKPIGDQNMTTPIIRRARHYALIIRLLYARQQLSGQLQQVLRGARHLSYGVKLFDPMQLDKALKLAEPLALASRSQAVLAQRAEGLVTYQFQRTLICVVSGQQQRQILYGRTQRQNTIRCKQTLILRMRPAMAAFIRHKHHKPQ